MPTASRSIIVGGTSKAGTTSLFNELAMHPRVDAALGKETRFFLDQEYPLPSAKRYDGSNPEDYESYYLNGNLAVSGQYRLEATPDYLYSRSAAKSIKDVVPDPRLVFILREPISRLKSWYRFGVSMNEIPAKTVFREWIRAQKENRELYPANIRHPVFAALQHGLYSKYLKSYVELFGREAIYICFIEDLRRDNAKFIEDVLGWLELPVDEFESKSVRVANKGVASKNPALHQKYVRFSELIRLYMRRVPRVKKAMRPISGAFKSLYGRMNTKEMLPVEIDDETLEYLTDYYSNEAPDLKRLYGARPPWNAY